MKILLVFSSSKIGGAERSLTRMTLVPQENVEYKLATLDGNGEWVTWCNQIGIKPVVLGKRTGLNTHGKFNFFTILKLLIFVRKEKFSAVYIIGFRASFVFRFFKPFLGGASIVQGIRWNPSSSSMLDKVFRILEKRFSFLIDCYICNSQIAAKTLVHRIGIPSEKIKVIYNGLDYFPTKINIKNSKNVILLANISPRKGHIEFLDVIKLVCNKIPEAHFFFVGRDDMGRRLEREINLRKIKQSITLTGYQSNIASWFLKSNILVLPSLWDEGCPTSILEAHSFGIPVIAYAIDGIPELVEDQVDGILISPFDTEKFAFAICNLLNNNQLATQMGQAGRQKVKSRFMLSTCASLHCSEFNKLSK